MAVRRRTMKTSTFCYSCESAMPRESLWIDDYQLCRQCALRLMLELINQRSLADQECFGELSPGCSREDRSES